LTDGQSAPAVSGFRPVQGKKCENKHVKKNWSDSVKANQVSLLRIPKIEKVDRSTIQLQQHSEPIMNNPCVKKV